MIKNLELNKNFGIASNIYSKFRYVVPLQQRTKVVTRFSGLTTGVGASPQPLVGPRSPSSAIDGRGCFARPRPSIAGPGSEAAGCFAAGDRGPNPFLKKIIKRKNVFTLAHKSLGFLKHEEYLLETFKRSNQDTCLTHKPNVTEGSWVQSGDLLTDCASSVGGELSLGQNLLIAYMPWEGYNFEDAILISERLVMDDLYTSIHIERYELETQKTKLGAEEITRNIPDVSEQEIAHLDSFGVVKLGSWVEEGDILVGKITPINKKKISPYQKLLYSILEKQVRPIKDSSLRAPKGIKAKVIDIKYFFKSVTKPSSTPPIAVPSPNGGDRGPFLSGEKQIKAKGKQQKQSKSERIITSPFFPHRGPSIEGQRGGGKKKFLKKINLFFSKINYSSFNIRFILFCSRFWPLLAQKRAQASLSKLVKQKPNREITNREITNREITNREITNREITNREITNREITNREIKREQKDKVKKAVFSFSRCFKSPTNSVLFKKPLFSFNFSFKTKATSLPFYTLPSGGWGTDLKDGAYSTGSFRSLAPRYPLKAIGGVATPPERGLLRRTPEGGAASLKNLNKKTSTKNIETIHIYLAEKRKIQVGDKMAGRHGNKGIVSQILPIQDMPFLPDGTPIDMVLNPLGVPSRMNVGQIYECLLGFAGKFLGENYKVYSFDEIYGPEASRSFVFNKLYEASTKTGFQWLFDPNSPGKIRLFDGRNGEFFDQKVTVGLAYMLRLVHMVDDKIHCLTPDHEVLTSEGWLPIGEISIKHQVATLKKTGELVYQKPNNVFHYNNYKGSLYHVKNTNIDLVVTLNHRMYVRKGTIEEIEEKDESYMQDVSFKDYQLIQAKNIIGQYYRYLKNANWIKKDYQFILPSVISKRFPPGTASVFIPDKKVDMDAWLVFFGLWIAEGWVVRSKTADPLTPGTAIEGLGRRWRSNPGSVGTGWVEAGPLSPAPATEALRPNPSMAGPCEARSQGSAIEGHRGGSGFKIQVCPNKQRVLSILGNAVTKLGYKYKVIDNKLTIFNKQLWSYLRLLSLGAPNKSLPSWVWQLSQKQAQLLLQSMCLGDGTFINNSLIFSTSSVKLADEVMRLALHAGWSGNKEPFGSEPKGSYGSYLHFKKGSISNADGRSFTAYHDLWRVSIIKDKNNPAVNYGHQQNQQIEEVLPYEGPVYCLSVPNEVFYVRRNGIPVWTGNSRSTGPYSLVTQQPLRGRSKQGGQRLGEMEVWALEGYGAAFTLLEMLTIKSDDMTGRMTLWSNLILNKDISIGTPESFKVLICELQALCLDIGLYRSESRNAETHNQKGSVNLREIQNLMNLP